MRPDLSSSSVLHYWLQPFFFVVGPVGPVGPARPVIQWSFQQRSPTYPVEKGRSTSCIGFYQFLHATKRTFVIGYISTPHITHLSKDSPYRWGLPARRSYQRGCCNGSVPGQYGDLRKTGGRQRQQTTAFHCLLPLHPCPTDVRDEGTPSFLLPSLCCEPVRASAISRTPPTLIQAI